MKNTKHTAGEWHESNTGNHQGLVIDQEGNNIAVTYDKANARLIASAPLMLEALEAVYADNNTNEAMPDHVLQMVEKAIAKAKGE